MDHCIESIYFDLLEREMGDRQPMSLWGPGQAIYKPTTTSAQASNAGSNPTTPAYSQCLELENKMLGSPGSCMHTTVIAGSPRQQPVCPGPPPLIAPSISLPSTSAGKRSRKNQYVDPCVIAPLKKRRIQVDLLNAEERSKVLQKREKNKVAAEKCRIKRREKVEQTRSEYYDCQELNESLEAQVKQLKKERQMLEELLKTHRCVKQHA